jgi:hypothetical protein
MGAIQGVEGVPNLKAMKNIKKVVNTLLEQEEIRWKQRAKIDWLQYGDKNTKFFHACANQRQKANCIRTICDARGIMREDAVNIGKAFVDYFTSLFTSE